MQFWQSNRISGGITFERDTAMPAFNQGAPCPLVLAGEHHLIVCYYMNRPTPEFDGTNPKSMSETKANEPCAVVRFEGVEDFRFGPPNLDSAVKLTELFPDFKPWGAHVTNMRNWVSDILQAPKTPIAPLHSAGLRHYVLSFHDSTIEVIARGYCVEEGVGSVHAMIAKQHALRERVSD